MIAEMVRQWQALNSDEMYQDADDLADDIFMAVLEMVKEFDEIEPIDRETLVMMRFGLS